MTDTDRLDALEAREQIRTLTANYSHGIDKRDPDRFLSIWGEAAEWEPQPGVPWCSGHQEILKMAEGIWGAIQQTAHWVCNHVIEVDGDRATGLSDADCVALSPEGVWTRTGASYDDVYERIDGQWKIVRRTCRIHHSVPIAAPEEPS